MSKTNEMITILDASKRLGMSPEVLRNQIIKKRTPFKAWVVKTPSGSLRFFIPRNSFENWISNASDNEENVYC